VTVLCLAAVKSLYFEVHAGLVKHGVLLYEEMKIKLHRALAHTFRSILEECSKRFMPAESGNEISA